MSEPLLDRLWAVVLSVLAMVLVLRFVWMLVMSVLPAIVFVSALVLLAAVWNRRRWRTW